MRYARTEAGLLIEASADAPSSAHCPGCGGQVILRFRRRGNAPNETTYFWRHLDNANRHCSNRFQAARATRLRENIERFNKL